MAKALVGTSGWNYKHWRERFYPKDVAQRRWLEFYAERFSTAEVNYSFYKLPSQSTYEKWTEQVDTDFVFSLKCSRLISHAKKLTNLGDLWSNFLNNAMALGEHLGPILIQLPERFEKNEDRLEEFLSYVRSERPEAKVLRLAIEFRHESWLNKSIYRTLEKHQASLCVSDSSVFPSSDVVTSDFCYMRFHGPLQLFGSNYSSQRLAAEAKKIEKLLRDKIDVYVYFNNDGHAYAINNALQLRDFVDRAKSRAA